jgi:oxygen-independent coproporphyrinogen III oxidase
MMTINNTIAANCNDRSLNTDDTAIPRKSLGLYLHIPFCLRKCNYCDFLSFGGIPEEEQKEYFRSLVHEIETNSQIYSNKYYVDSIFIGGGTPSLVQEGLILELMRVVRDRFDVDKNAEISIESNPKTLTKNKLDTYLEAGINRLSIGAQSFDDNLLNHLGRVHSTEDFMTNYSLARACGFRNINIDLMFAVPGQTLQIWMDTLQRAIGLEPEHISFYSLQLEEGTPFYSMFQEGSLKETDEELDRDMYHRAAEVLKDSGYLHYEISNAAKPGFQCRHNLKYWSMDDYLGLGLGAHSFMNGMRFNNAADLKEYIAAPGVLGQHWNTKEDNISEYLFTGMRKIQGIELEDFQERFGISLESIHGKTLEKYRESGLIKITDGRLRFTEKGIDVSNTVLAEFV